MSIDAQSAMPGNLTRIADLNLAQLTLPLGLAQVFRGQGSLSGLLAGALDADALPS